LSLNINTIPKPNSNSSSYYGGGEFYPWVSPNGKVLIFTRYDYEDTTNNSPKIYVSHLLIDENGNPVSVRNNKSNNSQSKRHYSISNYPNPFNPSTKISYQLAKSGYVTLKVYDILGREVATLVNENQIEGVHSAVFDASRLASGVYLYRLTAPGINQVKKMLLTK